MKWERYSHSLYPPGRRQREEVEEKHMTTTWAAVPGGVPPEGDEPTGHEDESQ